MVELGFYREYLSLKIPVTAFVIFELNLSTNQFFKNILKLSNVG